MTEKNVDKVRLGKVEVKMGAKSVTLTIDQARELCALLKGLFGDDATKIVHVHDYWYNRPWYATGPQWQYTGIQWTSGLSNSGGGVVNSAIPRPIYTSDVHSLGGGVGGSTMTFTLKN